MNNLYAEYSRIEEDGGMSPKDWLQLQIITELKKLNQRMEKIENILLDWRQYG